MPSSLTDRSVGFIGDYPVKCEKRKFLVPSRSDRRSDPGVARPGVSLPDSGAIAAYFARCGWLDGEAGDQQGELVTNDAAVKDEGWSTRRMGESFPAIQDAVASGQVQLQPAKTVPGRTRAESWCTPTSRKRLPRRAGQRRDSSSALSAERSRPSKSSRDQGLTRRSQMEPKAKFYQVLISAELRTQGLRLLDHLLRKHLIFGGPVLNGPAASCGRERDRGA